MSDEEVVAVGVRCANCAAALTGPFCANCGQTARDFHRSLWTLLSELAGEIFGLDTRLMRTLRPLLLKPGLVTKEYLKRALANQEESALAATFRRVYGGSGLMTAVKSVAFLFLNVFGFSSLGFIFVTMMAVLTF